MNEKIINGSKPAEPETMPVLFVGGPHDGKRIGMEALPSIVEMPYTQQAGIMTEQNPDAVATPMLKKARYRREGIKTAAGLYPLYVLDTIPSQDVVYTLLEGYRESEDDRAAIH